MAWGDKKIELAVLIAKKEAEVEHLREENKFLRGQVEKLQEALYAKESPVAYQQMSGQPLTIESRWDGFGSMMFAVESILIAGGLYGAATWVWSRRQTDRGDENA